MLNFRKTVIAAALFIAALSLAAGQEGGSGQELSVEESYLQESVELMIIRETSRSDNRDQKQIAIRYLGDAIKRGNTGEEVRGALEYLSMEGVMSKARENGRLVNNYPDVRKDAAALLGELGTPEAKDTLIRICIADPEPMVLQEAVKSLGKIGLNDNEETVAAIAWIVTRFDVLNPDNLLALSAVDAFDRIAAKNNGIKDPNAIRMLIRIASGPYIKPVRDRAEQVLQNLRKYNIQNSQNQGR
ncbi:MAG: HEAT repeat domain-containing protein [Treponema sp.]|jgi:HEAT repeat protein|nr:HEAT repeat domain-containing protein [Treponema sp.]